MGDTCRRAKGRHPSIRGLLPTFFALLAATIAVGCGSDRSLERADSTPTSLAQRDAASTSTSQAIVEPQASQIPTTMLPRNPPETDPPTSMQLNAGPAHEWVRRNWQFTEFAGTIDGIRYAMDHGDADLPEVLDYCVTKASDLGLRSSTDTVIADQAQRFGDIATTCSSMAQAAASSDAAALAQGRSVLEAELDDLKEIFNAFHELMMFGDANDPSPTEALPTSTGPLEFVDGTFLDIRQGSLLTDVVAVLGVGTMMLSEAERAQPVYACTGTADPRVIRSGGLTLVFERWTPSDDYVLTNWRYIGGPVAGFTEMVGPGNIRIGDTRDKVEAAFPDFTDLGDEISVGSPVQRFGLVDNIVDWFGPIDCVFEFAPTD